MTVRCHKTVINAAHDIVVGISRALYPKDGEPVKIEVLIRNFGAREYIVSVSDFKGATVEVEDWGGEFPIKCAQTTTEFCLKVLPQSREWSFRFELLPLDRERSSFFFYFHRE